MGMTVLHIADKLRTEADAYLFLEELRWGEGEPVCPHCDGTGASFIQPANGASRKTRTGAMSERRVWRCFTCRKQFSVITGTVFHGTRPPLRTWVLVIFEMCASKNGVSAREIQRKYGTCPRSAWFMLHRIREAMRDDALVQSVHGVVMADETYMGGDPKNWHQSKHDRSNVKSGRGTPKVAVLTLVEKHSGEARSRVIPDVTGATLYQAIKEEVDPSESILQTDGLPAYGQVGKTFVAHETVDHHAGEYVRDDVSTNMVEGFFSQLKRSIDGTHHHVSREHLPRYLDEFDFRYTTRKLSDAHRMVALMEQVGGRRLTYKGVTS